MEIVDPKCAVITATREGSKTVTASIAFSSLDQNNASYEFNLPAGKYTTAISSRTKRVFGYFSNSKQ